MTKVIEYEPQSGLNIRPSRWAKVTMSGGYKIPDKCPACRSKDTCVTTYADGEKYVECRGCNTVIAHIKTRRTHAKS